MQDSVEMEEIDITDPVVKFETNVNLEQLKRDFFNKNYENFLRDTFELVESNKVFLLEGIYRYNDEYDGRPFFAAKNRVNGFENSLQEFKKYLFAKFEVKIIQESPTKYNFTSLWIVNSADFLLNMKKTESDFDDFDFIDISYKDFTEKFIMQNEFNEKIQFKYLH
jgi:hypothetical protein